MKSREAILVLADQVSLDKLVELYGFTDVRDITALMEPSQYGGKSRTGVAGELDKTMPHATHQRVSVIFPMTEGETLYDWTIRIWSHPIISIISSSFKLQHPYCGGGISHLAS